jgi:hypothetical protein
MIFTIDRGGDELQGISERRLEELNVLEREDLQGWAIEEPQILGEDLLVVTSEYTGFQDIRDRLDILAIDRAKNLVVVELKRDKADRTTDLQAIKYASYCATLTFEDVQKEYREFWSDRNDETLSPEDVGEEFAGFLADSLDSEQPFTDEGWAKFTLDDKPRILLAAGEFGTEITSPVMWMIEEYGMDVTCTRIDAYDLDDGTILVNSQQIIPVPEAEEYMTKRREKQERQETDSGKRTIDLLLDRGVLQPGDEITFTERRRPSESEWLIDPDPDFWRVEVTGDTGQSDNIKWLHDDEVYSFSGLTRKILHELIGRDIEKPKNGYKYWCHPEFDHRHLSELKDQGVKALERKSK